MLADCEEIVQEEVEGLRGLVREFSEFARLPQPHPQPGDLGELLGELVRLYGDQRVSLAIGGPSLEAWFDAAELRRALINLIDNGLAASATAGRSEHVGLDAGPEGAEIVVNVRDEGCGIKPQDLGRIFEPDFSTKKEGMGLGLCIVEQIVRGHGGTIAVESQPGRGTCFTIRLPRRKPSKGT
jgi:two-component system nitrogen regulation sensor histidine kinase NtrY